MSKEKFRLENKLGTSGAILTVFLVITTIITALLFIISNFLRFILNESDRMQSFLEPFGIDKGALRDTFEISRSLSWIGSAPMYIALIAAILFLLIIWVSLYKLNSVYTYRAFRGYGVSLICVSGILILLGLFIGPLMNNFAQGYYSYYQDAFAVGKWLLIFSSLPVFTLGLVMLLLSLFAAFPAKTDMKRPRKNGERDVSFIMDDEEAKQSYEYSVSDKTFKKTSIENSVQSDDVQTAYAEIVDSTCPNCGNSTCEGDIFCINCGTKL